MNSTILAWQFAGYNIFWWLMATIPGIYLGWVAKTGSKARSNGRHLLPPQFVSDNMCIIDFDQPRKIYPQLRIIVIDCDLTCSGMWLSRMHPLAVHKLRTLMQEGWLIVLASKSNSHLEEMRRVHFDNDNRMLCISKAHKNSVTFLLRVVNLIRQERPDWNIDRLLKSVQVNSQDRLFVLVGDKLTDMGNYEASHAHYTVGVLTNRQFKRFGFMYDFPWEIFPLLRRYFEDLTLKFMDVKRADHGEFREA